MEHVQTPPSCRAGGSARFTQTLRDSPAKPPFITLIEYGPDCLEERKDVDSDELLPHLNNELVTWINIDGLGDLSVLRILGNASTSIRWPWKTSLIRASGPR